jgi:hypothetical protein
VSTGRRWTGRETRALRLALNWTLGRFAQELEVTTRTVSYWEARGTAMAPMPRHQKTLSRLLTGSGPSIQKHYHDVLSHRSSSAPAQSAPAPERRPATIGRRDLFQCVCGALFAPGLLGVCDRCGARLTTMQALRALSSGTDGVASAADSIDELVNHFARTAHRKPPALVYHDLLAARSFARTILDTAGPPHRTRISVAAGWLSNLLAVVTSQLGDHAAASVWCADTERYGHDTRNPHLLAWAIHTRAVMAYYQGDARRSAETARRGQQFARSGTVPHARLAAQEMRSHAMLGNHRATVDARIRAERSLAALPPRNVTGVFGLAPSEDPPYTATSLLLLGHHQEAVKATQRVLDTTYSPQERGSRSNPSGCARALLILALAHAGLGNLDEAAAVGKEALETTDAVWPTRVLAEQLNNALLQYSPATTEVTEFRSVYARTTSAPVFPQPPVPQETQ